ncbi:MAG TPA: PIN domain-containing protein [Streptosporangiaceae bacterium]
MRKWNSSSRTSTPLATPTLPDRAPTRYVVLDTDVASRVIKRQLGDPLAARLTGATWCVTFVTVGELWQWATMRSWGPRAREDLEHWLGRVVVLNSDDATSRTWGRISAAARRRGRTRPANDSWIAASCLVHRFALATLNVKDFEDFAEHEGLLLITS